MSFLNEFKAFVTRGNVLDLAVAVVIGAAFGGVVNSFVTDVLMPPIGVLIGGIDFSGFEWVLKHGEPDVVLRYGVFLNAIVSFLIISFCVFLLIKLLSKLHRKKETETKECPECCLAIPLAAKKCAHCGSNQG